MTYLLPLCSASLAVCIVFVCFSLGVFYSLVPIDAAIRLAFSTPFGLHSFGYGRTYCAFPFFDTHSDLLSLSLSPSLSFPPLSLFLFLSIFYVVLATSVCQCVCHLCVCRSVFVSSCLHTFLCVFCSVPLCSLVFTDVCVRCWCMCGVG